MSSLEQGSPQETQEQQQKGIEAFLSQEERASLQRMLSHPEDFPKAFGSWIQDYMAVNISQIPLSQIVGFKQLQASDAPTIATSQTTTDTSYTDLATVGPKLTGIGGGQFLILFGAFAGIDSVAGNKVARMSLSYNGAAAADIDSIESGDVTGVSICRAVFKTFSTQNNTITAKYRTNVAGTATFENRWLIALKIGN